jgi:hypothetical protein
MNFLKEWESCIEGTDSQDGYICSPMKKLFLFFAVALFSCSGNVEERQQPITGDTQTVVNTIPPPAPDTASCPSAGYRNFISIASKAGFVSNDTSVYFKNDQQHFFGLANVNNTFSAMEMTIMAKTKNACLKLEKKLNGKPVQFEVEEWTFEGQSQAELIEHALTAPLKDRTDMRFITSPFTFWRVKQRIYYIHTSDEKARTELNTLNDLLVNSVSIRN